MYQCDESQHLIMVCINIMENGSHRDISTTLLKFLRCAYTILSGCTTFQRLPFEMLCSASDFTIMFDDKKGDMAVFLLLELACIELCKISFARRQSIHTQKKQPPNILHERFIYNTMVWGTYVYFCCSTLWLVSSYLQCRCLWKWGPAEELWPGALPSNGRTISPVEVTL